MGGMGGMGGGMGMEELMRDPAALEQVVVFLCVCVC